MTCELFIIPLNERAEGPAEKLASLVLHPSEVHDLNTLIGRRRSQYLISRFYLKILLSGMYGLLKPIEMALRRRDGLPPLLTPSQDVYFSISHSHDVVLLAVSRNKPIAVDVERHKRRNFLEFSEAYFHSGVYSELKALDERGLESSFYQYWARLEAGLKLASGSVFSDEMSRYCPSELSVHQEGHLFTSYACQYESYSIALACRQEVKVSAFMFNCAETKFDFTPLTLNLRPQVFVVEE